MNRHALPAPAEARPWTFPRPSTMTLPNGLRVLECAMPGHSLLSVELVLDLPLPCEPAGLDGIRTVLASVLEDRLLESSNGRAGNLGTSSCADFTVSSNPHGVRLRSVCTAATLVHALRRLSTCLRPIGTTDGDATALASHVTERIQREARRRSPPELTAVYQALFGLHHRLGRAWQGSRTTLSRIGTTELAQFYRAHVQPRWATLVLAGDLPPGLDAEIARCFGWWQSSPGSRAPLPSLPTSPATGQVLLERPSYSQCQITLACAVPGPEDTSWPALLSAVCYLGGSQLALIDLLLRERLGYTFGFRASLCALPGGGTVRVSGFAASQHAPAACRSLLDILARLRDEGCPAAQRDAVIASLRGAAPRQLQTPRSVANVYADAAVRGLAPHYPARLHAALADVSPDDIRDAIARHLRPDRQVLALSGQGECVERVAAAVSTG